MILRCLLKVKTTRDKPPIACACPARFQAENTRSGARKFNLDGGASAAEYFQQIYRKQLANFPADNLSDAAFEAVLPQWEENFNRELDALGRKLWQILPQPVRDEYSNFIAPALYRIRFSSILMKPWSVGTCRAAFLDRRQTRRARASWHRTRPRPVAARPPHQTPSAKDGGPEVLRGKAVLWRPGSPGRRVRGTRRSAQIAPRIHCVSPATRNVIHGEVLDRGDVQVFHFSGHGSYDPANTDLNALLLEDGDLNATLITASRLAAEAQPIVFLNACSVGSSGFVIGRARRLCGEFPGKRRQRRDRSLLAGA